MKALAAIVTIIATIILALVALQSPKISEISEKTVALEASLSDVPDKLSTLNDTVIRLNTSLGTAPAEIKANAAQVEKATRNLQGLEGKFTAIYKDFQTAQTALSQSTADISSLRNDFNAFDQKITKQIDARFAALNESVSRIDAVYKRMGAIEDRFASLEKRLFPILDKINKKVDKIAKPNGPE